MAQHLKACKERKIQQKAGLEGKETHKETLYHLIVEDRYLPGYWMHLELPGSAMLEDLDDFLREIWLECCDHLSDFRIDGDSYASHLENEGDIDEIKADERKVEEQLRNELLEEYMRRLPPGLPQEQVELFRKQFQETWRPLHEEYGMNVPINKLFRADMKIAYTYDFGSSTDLNIRVLMPYESEIAEPKIRVLARNLAPAIACEGCGKSATQIASDDWGNCNYYCDDCAGKKKETYEYTSPIVNSPRMGVCGYTGGSYTDMREWVIGQEVDYEYDEEEDMDEDEGTNQPFVGA